jgi:circadian clock protein KaiC
VIKKRAGNHEDTIRELRLVGGKGIEVGEPLRSFRNVLGGNPAFAGPERDVPHDADAFGGH